MTDPARSAAVTPIILTDMDRCLPASGLSTSPRRGAWRLVPYRTDGFGGTMLVAANETSAPEVRYPLELTGWHRISIGAFQERWDEIGSFQVRLSRDRAFSALSVPSGPAAVFRDVYWKTADLTGQEVVFRQLHNVWDTEERPAIVRHPARRARIAYLVLEPLTEDEVAAFIAEQADRATKRLFAHDDAHGYLWWFGVRGPEDVQRELEPYRESDFSRIYWEAAMGDTVFYLGREGRPPTCDGIDDFQYYADRIHAENWRWLRDTGLDPFRVALDYAHEIGLEFHAAYRPAGFYFPPLADQWNAGGFYEAHPELRAVNRDGSPAPRISFTFPETRRFVLAILREVAEYGVDGIAIEYIRRPPLASYEPPIVDAFRAETGLDARALPEDDERWLRFRCRVLNEFMRELRAELDAVAAAQGRDKRIEITAMVSARQEENVRDGMDAAAWIADGTVDTLIPYTMAPELVSSEEAWPDPASADVWLDLVRGTPVRVSFSILPRWKSPEDYRRVAQALYRRGAESLFFWDAGGQRVNFMDQFAWNAFKRLGHRDEVLDWQDPGTGRDAALRAHTLLLNVPVGDPSPEVPTRAAVQIGSYDLSYRTPG